MAHTESPQDRAAFAAHEARRRDATHAVGSEPISRLQVPETADLPAALRAVYDQLEASQGFVPHWLRALSVNPDTALRLARLHAHLFDPERSQLNAAERELVAVVACAANRCSYGVFEHTHALGEALCDPVRARRIALDHHHVRLSMREQALAHVAEKLTTEPTQVGNAELDRLRQAGFDEPAALEVLELVAFFNYSSRLLIALNVMPDQQLFSH